jgi:hypothetical protein
MTVPQRLLNSVLLTLGCWLSLQALRPLPGVAQPNPAPQPPACLSGYPNGTYRGDQPVTRDEFAAGMNACIQQMTPRERLLLLQPERANLATKDDFRVLIERQQNLNQQLRELSDRVGELADPNSKPANP